MHDINKTLCLTLGILLTPMIVACNNNSSNDVPASSLTPNYPVEKTIEGNTLWQGQIYEILPDSPDIGAGQPVIVNNQADYQKVWNYYHPNDKGVPVTAPNVDFSQGQIVFIDFGAFPSPAWDVHFVSAKQTGQQTMVTTALNAPAPDTLSAAVITRPLQVVYLKSLQPISIKVNKTIYAESDYLSSLNTDKSPELSARSNLQIIKSKDALTQAAETKLGNPLPTEAVNTINSLDFQRGQVVLLDMGSFSKGGYNVSYDPKIEVIDGSGILKVNFNSPDPNCNTIQSFTNPYKFVWIPTTANIAIQATPTLYTCR